MNKMKKDTVVEEIIPEENDAGMSDTLFIIGFSIFVLFLFVGEIVVLIYLTKHGYIDRFLDVIP